MSLVDTLRKDMFEARKSQDSTRSDILSMAIASIVNAKISKGEDLTETEQQDIVRKEIKKLQDAYDQYIAGGRADLADKEKTQKDILDAYVPQLMSEQEVLEVVKAKVSTMQVSASDFGKVMQAVMQELKGKADGATVSKAVKQVLG